MAETTANDEPTGSTFSATKISYLAKAYDISDDEIHMLISAASPTAELAQKFMTSIYTKAKAYDELQSRFMEYKSKTERPPHFMRLPSELRVQIYELDFYGVLDGVPCRAKRNTNRKAEARRAIIRHIKTAMAMAHTNSVIRIEALPVYRQLASAAQESAVANLDQLNPGWMVRFSLLDQMDFALHLGFETFEKCADLEYRYWYVADICDVLELEKTDSIQNHEEEVYERNWKRKEMRKLVLETHPGGN